MTRRDLRAHLVDKPAPPPTYLEVAAEFGWTDGQLPPTVELTPVVPS